jgi:hypothetical protein
MTTMPKPLDTTHNTIIDLDEVAIALREITPCEVCKSPLAIHIDVDRDWQIVRTHDLGCEARAE